MTHDSTSAPAAQSKYPCDGTACQMCNCRTPAARQESAERTPSDSPVGVIVADDPVHGWHMKALKPWGEIGAGTLLYIGNAAPTEADENAPWLTLAHTICADVGIEPGHITDRLTTLRDLLDAALRGNAATAAPTGLLRYDCVLTPDGKAEMYASENGAYVWFDHVAPFLASNAGAAQPCPHCDGHDSYVHKDSVVDCRVCGGTGTQAAPSPVSPVGAKEKE